ncbi:putative N-myristoyl transferase [Trypanosoma theileri]|uniref:Glycylpeptide N-tetradecanoyltransferase n=1 Tax=Trypanosoma theileri TaxID=67003 RepID=A0A1X0P7N7_9TRYP|nr:putative N-myristoyl transferase [Trypanosoma theileri]ORC92579.1 putative N-myristoyl transferase [Trypanosoma theileri]
MSDEASNSHKFWNTQPVLQPGSKGADRVGPLEQQRTVEEVSTDPLPVPSTCEWWTPNMEDENDMHAIYELLRDNYVEDDDSMFRFNYQESFLRWALTPPGYHPSWHVAVRRKRDQMLLGFVSGIPITMRMGTPKRILNKRNKETQEEGEKEQEEKDKNEDYLEPRTICEINFLCVHKLLRDKGMAPILIREVTRRVNLCNIWQAVYTAGKMLPTPFSTGRYFHRSLNCEKLVDIRFSGLPASYKKFQNPMAMLKRLYQVPNTPKTRGLRPMEAKDVPQVTKLLRDTLATYDVAPVFNEEEVAHYFLPRDGVLITYVVEREVTGGGSSNQKDHTHSGAVGTTSDDTKQNKGESKRVTDFFSFFSLPSTVIGNSKYNMLNAAYVYYYAATSVPLSQLMSDLLIIANQKGFDVCNCVSILGNGSFVEELKFALGDGSLHYYFYNWAYPNVEPSDVGLCML